MFTEMEFFAGATIVLGLAGALIIALLRAREEHAEVEPPTQKTEQTVRRIAPFIEIHQSVFKTPKASSSQASINQLKDKIESFKHRNRFYGGDINTDVNW